MPVASPARIGNIQVGQDSMSEVRVDRPVRPPSDVPGPRHARWSGLGLALIGLWVAWWAVSIRQDSLAMGRWTWVPSLSFLAGDFKVHIDHVARVAASGVDPACLANDFVCATYPYPPTITRSFAWVPWFDPATAAVIWQVSVGLLVASGGLAAHRARRELGIASIPPSLVVAAALFSTPALFAMERGQADPMVILPLIASAWLLRRPAAWPEVVAGGMLGATAWLKYYPGFSAFALLAMGRRRGLAAFVVVAGLIGLAERDEVLRSIRNGPIAAAMVADKVRHVHEIKHSITENWPSIGFVHRSKILKRVPGLVAAAVLLLPPVLIVGRRMARAGDPGPLIFPYLCWMTAAATYAMPLSNDYNLVCLPIAALAAWDRRDPWPIQVAMALLMAYWQPIAIPVGGEAVLFVKLAGLYAVGASLAIRAAGSGFVEGGTMPLHRGIVRPSIAVRTSG